MKIIKFLIVISVLSIFPSADSAEESKPTAVLLVAPVDLKSGWLDGVLIQTAAALRDNDRAIHPHIRYIAPGPAGTFRRKRTIDDLKTELSSADCGAIITFDAAIARFLIEERDAIGLTQPVIAARMPRDGLQNLRAQYENITGTIIYDAPENIAAQAARLFPLCSDIVLSFASELTHEQLNEMNYRLRLLLPNHRVHCLSGQESTPENIIAEIGKTNGRPIVIIDGWKTDYSNEPITERDFISALSAAYKVPVFSFSDEGRGAGLAGERLLTAENYGNIIAALTDRALSDKSAAGIAFKNESPPLTVDYKVLASLGAELTEIPPEAIVLNPPPEPVWPLILYIAGSGVIGMLIMLLVILRLQRIRRRDGMIAEIFHNLPLRVGLVDKDNRMLFGLLTTTDIKKKTLPNPEVSAVDYMPEPYRSEFQRMLAEVRSCPDEMQKKTYNIAGEHRMAIFVRLPSRRFGPDCVLWYSENIDELHRAMLDREAAADRLRLTLESISDAVVATDGNDTITICNPAAVRMMGLPGQDLIGLQLSELLRLRSSSGNRESASPSLTAMTERRHVNITADTALIGHNGSHRLVEGAAGPLIDGAGRIIGSVLALHDITEFVEAEHKYRNANVLLSSVLDNLPCMVFLKDCADESRYILANRAMADGLGMAMTEIIGKTDFELFPAATAKTYLHDDQTALGSNKVLDIVEELSAADGVRIMHTLKSGLTLSGDKKMLLGISFDITKEHALELEARRNLQIVSCLLASCPAGITAKDPTDNYRHVLWNLEMTAITGVASDAAIGKNADELAIFPADYIDAMGKIDAEVAKTGRKIEYKSKLSIKGEERIFRIIKSPAKIDETHSLLFTLIIDVTEDEHANGERARLLAELRNYVENERIVNGCLSVVAEGLDFDRTIQSLLRRVALPANADHSNVAIYSADYSGISIAFHWNAAEEKNGSAPAEPKRFRRDDGSGYERLSAHQAIMIDDINDKNCNMLPADAITYYRQLGISSLLVAPIFFENRLWGAFSLGFRLHRDISKLDERTIRAAANAVELALFRRTQFEKLFSSEREKSLILNNIDLPIMLFDAQCRLISRNMAAERWRPGSVQYNVPHDGKNCNSSSCHFPILPEHCPVRATVESGKPTQMEMTLSGGHTYLVSTMPVTDSSGKLLNILVSVVDTTLETMARDHLIQAREAAEAANTAKGTFLATMSHEIRTPLNAIVGFSELLELENPPPNIRKHLKDMRSASNSLLTIINDVLDMSKLEADKLDVSYEWVDPEELLKNIKLLLQQIAAKKHLELTAVIPEQVPDIWSSAPRLRQILVNLAGNAVKFTEHGGIQIELKLENVTAETADIIISVADTGIGIAPEVQRMVFEPFYQIEQPTRGTRSVAGTGLGLSIVKKLTEKMNGEITLNSRPGVGSTFFVTFRNASIRHRHKEVKATGAAATRKFRGTAWVIDDVKTNCMVLSSMLNKIGMHTEYMTSHTPLLERIAAGEHPDVLFTDMWMPEINGSELTAKLHEIPDCRTLPIIAVTADSEVGSNFDMSGFTGVLLKPITLEKIRLALQQLCDLGLLK
ncbi:MAG: PAS domain-containing protein [Victivallaceae bacterium]|nr:PAS domain-containing protein [Victivallaceae bacterium]